MRNPIRVQAIYVLWLRDMKRTWRAKSRVIGAVIMPIFFLIFLGSGFRRATMPGIPPGVDYMTFLIPGSVAMSLLFSSMFGGLQVLWDKEFGFLKEIMVTPVSRLTIVLGRMVAGSTIALIQSSMILGFSTLLGFRFHSVQGIFLGLGFMILIAFTFIGLGLSFASRMKDMHGFQLVMNFVVFPIFFLSGALYPVDSLPGFLKPLVYIDPLTYGVDGLRGAFVGIAARPLIWNFAILLILCIAVVTLGAVLFETSDVGQ